jgi:hypothetical protein
MLANHEEDMLMICVIGSNQRRLGLHSKSVAPGAEDLKEGQ